MLLWGYEKEGTNYSNLFGDCFASIELKLEKIGPDFSTFNQSPFLPSLATETPGNIFNT